MAPAGTVITDASAVERLLSSTPTEVRLVAAGGPRGARPEELDDALAAAASGACVIVSVDPDTDRTSVALGTLDTFEFGPLTSVPSASDPLLADTTVDAVSASGRPLRLDRVRPITEMPAASVIARTATGQVVAAELTIGRGRLIVVGTSSLLDERWLTAAANAEVVAEWIGAPDPEHAAARLATTSRPAPEPTAVPVVVASADWLDPSAATRPADDESLVALAGRLNRRLPETIHDALVDFADRSHPSGALLLRGLPVGTLPPTPPTPTSPADKDLTSELALLTVARRLGQPVGYLPEHGGTLWQNILPVRASLDRQVSTSSNVELMFHTEAAFHPHRPRFLLLLCLRGDPAARTTLASITDLLPAIPLAVRRTLFEPRFRTAADESYVGSRPTQLGAPMAVLSGDWDRPSLVFDADLMVGTDSEADRALELLAELVATHHQGIVLEPGDLLVVDNSVAVHGRSPFQARFDGTDRWLQRAFVVGDLTPSAGQRRGRVITTRFAG